MVGDIDGHKMHKERILPSGHQQTNISKVQVKCPLELCPGTGGTRTGSLTLRTGDIVLEDMTPENQSVVKVRCWGGCDGCCDGTRCLRASARLPATLCCAEEPWFSSWETSAEE